MSIREAHRAFANAQIEAQIDARVAAKLSEHGSAAGHLGAPQAAVASPIGGITVDSSARTAIDAIRNRLTTANITA
jgi:hypothetical protein